MNEKEETQSLLDAIRKALENSGFTVDSSGNIEPKYEYKLDLYADVEKDKDGKIISTGKLVDNE